MPSITPLQVVAQQQEINQALSNKRSDGSLFKLLLSMAHAEMPRVEQLDFTSDASAPDMPAHHYRQPSLAQSDQDFTKQTQLTNIIANHDLANLKLWLCMHPQPLSARNDALHIEKDVIDNTSYQTAKSFESQVPQSIKEDPTMLYDVLEDLKQLNF